MDWGEHHQHHIAELLQTRRESGIPVDAPMKILCAEWDLYIAEIGNPPLLRVALGPRHPGNPDETYWSKGPSGNHYRVWIHKVLGKECQDHITRPHASSTTSSSGMCYADDKAADNGLMNSAMERSGRLLVDGLPINEDALSAMSPSELELLALQLEAAARTAWAVRASMA